MKFSFDQIKRLVVWGIGNYDKFFTLADEAKALYDKAIALLADMPKVFFAESDELDLDSLYSNEDVIAAMESVADCGAYGAIDGSRLRAIVKFIKENPELLKILIALI